MADNFKLNVDIPQADIKSMAKQVIREIVEEKIQDAMKDIDINKIINGKLNDLNGRLDKMVKEIINKRTDDVVWGMRGEMNSAIRDIVLKEIEKKPLTGNIYLKIDSCNIGTDYDDY